MLILTRKIEQGIVIDGSVTVRLLSIEGERVKIGIDAPRAITVLREELLREVAGENQAALTRSDSRALSQHLRGLRPAQAGASADGGESGAGPPSGDVRREHGER